MSKPFEKDDIIYGFNPVKNALLGASKPKKILVSERRQDPEILDLAQDFGVSVEFVEPAFLDRLSRGRLHQGVVAYMPPYEFYDFSAFLKEIKGKKDSTVIVLDGIEDPNNFGSIIRTAACFEVDAIIIAKQRQVQMSPIVIKVATGAQQFVKIIQVVNLTMTIEKLKEVGYWVVASDGSGDRDYNEVNYDGKTALIVGGEGTGVGKLLLKNSDFVARIPISGPITSLNASIACAIFVSQIALSRSKKSQ